MKDLAVVMIVKNEEKNIRRMFDSFHSNGIEPDFYISDTGSTDKTIEICESLPNTYVFKQDPVKKFDESRNLSLSRVDASKYKWIMTIDADESIDTDIAKQIKNIFSDSVYFKYDAFWVHSNHLKAYARDSKLMIVKASLIGNGLVKYQYPIHEQIDKKNLNKKRIGHLYGALHHQNDRRVKNYNDAIKTYKFYTDIALKFIEEHPDNWYANWMIYQEYSYKSEWLKTNITKQEYKKYIQYYSKALELGFNTEDVEIRHFTKCLDVFYDTLEFLENWKMFFKTREEFESYIEEICGRMIIKCGLHPWIIRTLGQLYFYSHKYEKSIYWNNQMLESNPKLELNFEFNDLNYVGDIHTILEPFVRNMECYKQLGDLKNAKRCFDEAKYISPEHPQVLANESFFSKNI